MGHGSPGGARRQAAAGVAPQAPSQAGRAHGQEQLDELDWRAFVCTRCGTETWLAIAREQLLVDAQAMCDLIFGDPPVCTECQRPDLARG